MANSIRFFPFCILLLVAACIAGCTSQPAAPVAGPQAVTTIPTVAQTTAFPETAVTTAFPSQLSGSVTQPPTPETKVFLNEKGTLTTTTYKTFDFKDKGIEFIHPKEKFKVSVKSDKPVLAYAVNTEQASQLQALVPRFESYSEKIQWGLVNPLMAMGKVTDSTQEFTIEEVGRATYVVDGRWMSFDDKYSSSTEPFNFEITITKTYTPPV